MDGYRLVASEIAERLERLAPGDLVRLHVLRRDELRVYEIAAQTAVPDTCELWFLPVETLEREVAARRNAWLGTAVVPGSR
jgi:predicted metalloprotease with PDZ domain